ncbi:hypothetical protein Tco_0096538 [Tanacetum coccineum]
MTEAMALSDSAFRKRYRSSYKTPLLSPTLPVRKRYRGTFELILDTDSEGDELGDEDADEDREDESLDTDDKRKGSDDESLGLGDEDHGQQLAALAADTAVGEPLGLGYWALRHRELAVKEDRVPNTFEVDSKDGRVYTNIPAYVPSIAYVQTPPSPEWSSGSLPISPSSSVASSPIASPVATPTSTIAVDED